MHLSIHALSRVVAETHKNPHYGEDCRPVAIVFRATWPDERVVTGTLGDIEAKLAAEPMERTALILINGRSLGAEDFRESALYDVDYRRRYRGFDGVVRGSAEILSAFSLFCGLGVCSIR